MQVYLRNYFSPFYDALPEGHRKSRKAGTYSGLEKASAGFVKALSDRP
ncbi:hypothetical protein HRH25_08720 [Flavisolibacter sp. BT320]|nr:hypothetical protein [Flavisolibacter longurius]